MPARTRRTAAATAASDDGDVIDAVDLLAQELVDSSPSRQKAAKSGATKGSRKAQPAIKKFSKPKISMPAPAQPSLPALAQALASPSLISAYSDFPFKTALLLTQSDLDIEYSLGKKRKYKTLLGKFDHAAYPRAVKPVKRKIKHYRTRAAKLSSHRALVIAQTNARIKNLSKTKKGKAELASMDVDFDPSLFISSDEADPEPMPSAKGKGKAAKPAFNPMDEISGSDSSEEGGAGMVTLEEGTSVSDVDTDDESSSDDGEVGDSDDDAVVIKTERFD